MLSVGLDVHLKHVTICVLTRAARLFSGPRFDNWMS